MSVSRETFDTGKYFGEYRPMLIKIPSAESIISRDFDVFYSYDYDDSTEEVPR